MDHFYAVILAGGKGERFWPLSTAKSPKQLLSLIGDRPLLAQAVDRLDGLVPPERVRVITGADLVEATLKAVPELHRDHVIGEPEGRDTAPAVALACGLIKREDPDAVFCILTADHVIGDLPLFRDTLLACAEQAREQQALVTIGLKPSHPSTGFGYIRTGDSENEQRGVAFRKVESFVEKPDLKTAERYLQEGCYFWNSGMFVWSVSALENAFRIHAPECADLIAEVAANREPLAVLLQRIYPGIKKISIDYAIMEKADNILMAIGTFAWDDVGSWTALEHHFPTDEQSNVVIGRMAAHDSGRNIVYSKDHVTALVGVDDLVVVQAPGVTLVCHRDRAQDIKVLLAQLREREDCKDLL